MKPIDLTKFQKTIQKTITTGSVGFRDPKIWVSTGSLALNYTISGDFNKGIPLGKVSIFAGESGAGKSYIVSGNIIRNAQEQGIIVVLIDTENALDEAWLSALGVDTSPDKLMKINIAMIDEVASVISDFMKVYKADCDGVPEDERPRYLFVIDSIGMLMTQTDVDQFNKGEMKGDMGRKPRALKQLVTNCTNMFGQYDIGMVVTNHTYESQDMFNPDPKVTGGAGFVYAASILVVMQKLKLKVDEFGNKVTDVLGIRAKCACMKTRYNKPFENTTLEIPYSTGMNPYSGLIDLFENKGLLVKDGNKLAYTDLNGVKNSWFRKQIVQDTTILDTIMAEFPKKMETLGRDANGRIVEAEDIVQSDSDSE